MYSYITLTIFGVVLIFRTLLNKKSQIWRLSSSHARPTFTETDNNIITTWVLLFSLFSAFENKVLNFKVSVFRLYKPSSLKNTVCGGWLAVQLPKGGNALEKDSSKASYTHWLSKGTKEHCFSSLKQKTPENN